MSLFAADFAEKSAFVTGAGGGMGLNIARDLLAAGAHVTCFDLKPRPAELAEAAHYVQGDLTDAALVADAIGQCHAARGRLDGLVNAAGVLWFERDRSAVEIDLEVWDQVLAINLKGAVHTVRATVPRLMVQARASLSPEVKKVMRSRSS